MNTALFLFLGLGVTEGMLIFFAVLLLFGGKKIPELMRGLGRGVSEFNNARNSVNKELREGMNETDHKNTTSSTEQREKFNP